jgi:hypothetical protein
VTRIVCLLGLVVTAAGCGHSDPAPVAATPDPAAKARPLPPEVEFDPETATRMYQAQKAKKTRQK